jgi:hypothetical protein
MSEMTAIDIPHRQKLPAGKHWTLVYTAATATTIAIGTDNHDVLVRVTATGGDTDPVFSGRETIGNFEQRDYELASGDKVLVACDEGLTTISLWVD